jgi:hypothetical protein
MPDPERFEYTSEGSQTGEAALLPQLPLILTYKNQSVEAAGLLDTGATVNVLPYRVGLRLGHSGTGIPSHHADREPGPF